MSKLGEDSTVESSSFNGDFNNLPPDSSMPITSHKLTGNNYLPWSQSVLMFVKGKGKSEFLTGEITIPDKKEKAYKIWETENSKVMSWIVNSMTPEVGENFLLYETASEMWEAVKDTFSNKDNISELFSLEGLLHDLKQGELTVIDYYTKLSRYWQQLDTFEKPKWKCSEDGVLFRDFIEQRRVFKFLLGLNESLDEVRGRILGTKPLPKIREVVSEVRREESRKKIMLLKSGAAGINGEASALAAAKGNPGQILDNRSGQLFDNRQKKGRPWCDHCRRPGHVKDTCWRLHGKPQDWKPKQQIDKDAKGNTASSSSDSLGADLNLFSPGQLEQLQKMFLGLNASVVATGSVAKKGTYSSALNVKQEAPGSWIVDSGATDHMTGDSSVFSTFEPCKGYYKVKIADGSLSNVTGYGSVVISKNLTLHKVLFVPNLDCNLLSISKLTLDEKCVTKFYPTYCVFQAMISGKMIGIAEVQSGLYLLYAVAAKGIQCNSVGPELYPVESSYRSQ